MVQMIKQIAIDDISVPVLLSRLAGIFTIFGSISLFVMLLLHGSIIIIGGPLHMQSITNSYWLTVLTASVSLSAGVLILYSSHKMSKQPENKVWETMIILGSLIGLFHIGLFGLGGMLGLIGGILGLGNRI